MKINNATLITILFLCLGLKGISQNCVNTFENGISSIYGYTIEGAIDTIDPNYYIQCGNNFSNFPNLDNEDSVQIVTSATEFLLPNITNGVLKLNPTDENSSDRTTIRTTPFNIVDNILSFQFLQAGQANHGHAEAYFQYRLLDATNPNNLVELNSECFILYDEFNENFNDCLYDSVSSIVYTPSWVNYEIDVSQNQNTSVILEFTVTDCGTIATEGGINHYSTAYIDNICQSSISSNLGSITFDEEILINCPSEMFTISGSYEIPNCTDAEVLISLNMAPYDASNPTSTLGAVQIDSGTFNNFNFSFDVDPSTLNLDTSEDYNFFVTITLPNGDMITVHDRHEELTFNDCNSNFTCEYLNISLSQDIPSCNRIIGNPNGYEFCLDYVLPQGYASVSITLAFNQIDGPDNFSLNTSDLFNTGQDQNGNTIGTVCFNITEDLFQTPIQGSYGVNATIVVQDVHGNECKTDFARQPILDFTDCEEDCESITNFEISDGNIITWDGTAPSYVISFVKDSNCNEQFDDGAFPMAYQVVGNSYNLTNILNSFGACVLFKINSDCDNTPWCSIKFKGRDGWILSNSCLDSEEECPALDPRMTGDRLFCWNDVADEYTLEFIGDNTCSNGSTGDLISLQDTTTENCIDLRPFYNRIGKCFKIRVSYSDKCPTTECLIQFTQAGFETDGSCKIVEGRILTEPNVLKAFPNPAENEILISSEKIKMTAIELSNIYGRSMQKIKSINALKYNLNVSRYARGYYVLKITLNNGTVKFKNIILK